MDRRLESIEHWQNRLHQANYRLSKLAQVCGTSRRSLHRFVSRVYCCAPRLWIEKMRLEAARELFSSGKTLKEIAEYIGLTPSSLSRLILRLTGSSPSAYFGNNRMNPIRPPDLQLNIVEAMTASSSIPVAA
jgi:AraC-like DNA-binding protein